MLSVEKKTKLNEAQLWAAVCAVTVYLVYGVLELVQANALFGGWSAGWNKALTVVCVGALPYLVLTLAAYLNKECEGKIRQVLCVVAALDCAISATYILGSEVSTLNMYCYAANISGETLGWILTVVQFLFLLWIPRIPKLIAQIYSAVMVLLYSCSFMLEFMYGFEYGVKDFGQDGLFEILARAAFYAVVFLFSCELGKENESAFYTVLTKKAMKLLGEGESIEDDEFIGDNSVDDVILLTGSNDNGMGDTLSGFSLTDEQTDTPETEAVLKAKEKLLKAIEAREKECILDVGEYMAFDRAGSELGFNMNYGAYMTEIYGAYYFPLAKDEVAEITERANKLRKLFDTFDMPLFSCVMSAEEAGGEADVFYVSLEKQKYFGTTDYLPIADYGMKLISALGFVEEAFIEKFGGGNNE